MCKCSCYVFGHNRLLDGRLIGYAIAKGGKPMGSPPFASFISLVLFHKLRNLDSDACWYIVWIRQDIHVVLHDVRPILLGAEESDGGTDDGLSFLQGIFFLGAYNLIIQSVGERRYTKQLSELLSEKLRSVDAQRPSFLSTGEPCLWPDGR